MAASYFAPVRALAIASVKRTFRDKVALFFTFLFPLMFLLIFGAINRNDGGISFDVALLNHSNTEVAKQFVDQAQKNDSLKIATDLTTLDQAKEKMGRGEIDSILELPENFGVPNEQGIPSGKLIVYYEKASPQSGQTLAAVMQGVFEKMNQNITGINPPFVVEQQSTTTNNLSAFDYLFSGLLGFTILSLGIFGMINTFPAEKKGGSFRRLQVAPLKPSQLIFATGLSYLVSGLCSIALMVVTALVVFDFKMRGDYLSFLVLAVLGIITMFGFGLAIGGWAKNEAQAAPLGNLITFPMMFLSGVFFPRFLMPEWLQGITGYLPLTPIIDGLRMITAEGKSLFDLGPQLLMIGIWTIIIYVIAIKVFRWE